MKQLPHEAGKDQTWKHGTKYTMPRSFCFDPEHPLRAFCADIIHRPEFDNVVLVVIVISCVLLVYDNLFESRFKFVRF